MASKETGLEVNADKIKYTVMPRDQNTGKRHSIKTDNSSLESLFSKNLRLKYTEL